MSIFVYDDTPVPAAMWGRTNGWPSVNLHVSDGADHGDNGTPGTDEWEGEAILFTGGKKHALLWLQAAMAAVEALPEDPR